jgi:dTDP-4-amino-4,6-dideoxygalactose transaminase
MREAGLGATAMYKQVLPQIEGVAQRVTVRGELVNAQAFADRLISLPTHAGVTPAHLNKLRTLLN